MSCRYRHRPNAAMTADNVITLGTGDHGWDAVPGVTSPLMRAQPMPCLVCGLCIKKCSPLSLPLVSRDASVCQGMPGARYEATAECDVHGRSCIVTSDVVGPSAGSARKSFARDVRATGAF